MLEAKGLVKSYKGRKVVNNLSLTVGLIKPDKGSVYLNEKNITNLPMYMRARMGISYLPQEPSVFRKLTVKENIMSILETIKIEDKEREERLKSLLSELNISHLADNKAYTLSGGERRRVEITRALVTSPSFILLDEPFAGIDPIAVIEIQNIIAKLKKKSIGILITDHSVQETLAITDRAYIINDGKILVSGTPKEIAHSSKARAIYLGEKFRLMAEAHTREEEKRA